jgi:protein phosphatase
MHAQKNSFCVENDELNEWGLNISGHIRPKKFTIGNSCSNQIAMSCPSLEMRMIHRILESILKHLRDNPKEIGQFATSAEVSSVICQAISIFNAEPAVLQITGSVTIVGDLHGNLKSLVRIFEELGYPDSRHFVFLGDYIDRGPHSCEVLIFLYSLKIIYPKHIFLLRGNHEICQKTEQSIFRRECLTRFVSHIYSLLIDSFSSLPICAVINDGIFCVHGGLIPNLNLNTITKGSQESTGLMWSDPRDEVRGFVKSARGCGYYFGHDTIEDFLKRESLKLVIRSHEYCQEGFSWTFGQGSRCLTIFSSIDYCGEMNDGSVCIINELNEEEIYRIPYESMKVRCFPLIPSFILESFRFNQIDLDESSQDSQFHLTINLLV